MQSRSELDQGGEKRNVFNLVVPKHFYMYSNPERIIDKSSDRFEEPSGGDVSVHSPHRADLRMRP